MRFRNWAALALVIGIAIGLTACEALGPFGASGQPGELTSSEVRTLLTSVGATPGVLRETHVDVSLAGYCQQECSQGSATIVMSPGLSEQRVLAIRDDIVSKLVGAHVDGFELLLTLQQGPSRISLDATHAQYAAFWKLRRLADVQKVDLQSSTWIIHTTNRATINVTADTRSGVIPALTGSARVIDASGTFGKHVFLTARTADGRYFFVVDPQATPISHLALDQQILGDPALSGGSLDDSPLGRYRVVDLRVSALAAVPDTYLRYDALLADYPALYVHEVEFPDGILTVYGHITATDTAMIALRDVIASGARLSGAEIEQVSGRLDALTFDVPTKSDAALINSLALAHPEFRTLTDFRVVVRSP